MVLKKQAIRCDARERLGEELQQCHLEAIQLGEKEVQAIMSGDRQSLAETEQTVAKRQAQARRRHVCV